MKEINFNQNLKEGIKEISTELGFKISFNQNFDKILLDYLTVRTKIITAKSRNVFINPDFETDIKRHPKKKEIETIIDLAKKGKDLNRFQSKTLWQCKFHDHLQNEWRIFHFHLSLDKDKKYPKFVKQIDSLLFAYIDADRIVLLGTDTHEYGIFADTKWVKILHDHFPEIIEQYKSKTILEVFPKVNSKERQMLWDKGYSVAGTKIADTIYISPGIGRATSGHSEYVASTTIDIIRWINKLKEQILDLKDELIKYLNIDEANAEFKVIFGNKTLELHELSNNLKILEFPAILIEKEKLFKLPITKLSYK